MMEGLLQKQQDSQKTELQRAQEQQQKGLGRLLTLEIVRVVERAAIAAAGLRGRGEEKVADQAAVDAMRHELNDLPIRGRVVIGEGERDEAPMLYIGEEVGSRGGPRLDIALDPLEGTTLCAKNLPNALSVIAFSEEGGLLNAPDSYMQKIAIGPGYPKGIIDLSASVEDNIRAVAKAKGVSPSQLCVCVLERPRHASLIQEIRATGAAIRLIGDGDVAGVIYTTNPEETGVDLYMGVGGAPEGVLAAAALRCIGGQMQGRLTLLRLDQEERAAAMGIQNLSHVYSMEEMARGPVLFAATGVTDGDFLKGVRFRRNRIDTHSVVMRSCTGTIRWIKAEHERMRDSL